MDLEARKYEFIQKLFQVNETLLEQLEYVLNKGSNKPNQISIEQYNKEIDEAISDIENGEFYTEDEARKIANKW